MVNELIEQLKQKVGLSGEQAHSTLQTIRQYVVEKFPMLAGAVDNIFPVGDAAHTPATPTTPTSPGTQATPQQPGGNMLDKISDYIPGQTGQNIEDFAKKAAGSAGDFFNKK